MNKVVAILAVIAAVFLLSAYESAPPQREGRYHIVSSKVMLPTIAAGDSPFDVAFLVDSQTGKTWIYQHYELGNGGGIIPSHFSSVFVDDLDGSYPLYAQRMLRATKSTTSTGDNK